MASQGSVVARVYTSDAYLPLYNVPVVFHMNSQDGQSELLAVRTTNSSGLTTPVYVTTPDPDQSLSPGPTIRPYTAINISVAVPGYNTVTAEGVQIFPGIQTIQALQLYPLSPSSANNMTVIPEPPQNL